MKRRNHRAFAIAGPLLSAAIVVAGCAGEEAAPSGDANAGQIIPAGDVSDTLVVTFGSEPSPPEQGHNTFQVTVRRADGSPVTDATVTAVFSMPAMPSMNMPAMRSDAILQHESGGRYRGTGQLSMGGTWNVAINVVEGSTHVATRRTSIVAKE